MKRSKYRPKLGFFLVQLSNSLSYVGLGNTTMLMFTFWYTSGSIIAAKYAPWFNLWIFILLGIIFWTSVIIFDWIFIYPSRQGVLSTEAYKHANPAIDDLKKLLKNDEILLSNDKKIMKKLGIE